MKKSICLLLAVVFTALFAVSCGTQQPESFDVDFSAENSNEATDLGGFKMKYALCASTLYGDTLAENVLGFAINTSFSDLAQERMAEIESNYNCDIQPFYAVDGATIDLFNTNSMSGNYYADVVQGTSEFMSTSARAGFCVGLSEITDVIDYTDSAKWGTADMLESMCWGDDCYAVLPNAWPELNYTSFGYPIVANMEKAREIGQGNLREVVENDEWIWDKFHEVLRAGTITEGTETVLYGMTVHSRYLGEMILRSNGDTLIVQNDDGTFSSGYYKSHAMTALTEFQNLYNGEYADCFHKADDAAPDTIITNFVEGLSLLTSCDTEHLYGVNAKISQNVTDFAILPPPTGPDVDPSYRFSVHESMRFAICFSQFGLDPQTSAYIVNALYEPLPGFETFDDIRDFMTHNYFFDPRDADVFFEMFNNSTYNYFRWGLRNIVETICDQSNRTVTEILGNLENTTIDNINTNVTPARTAMDVMWPTEANG